jgi:putative lipase involved disintegration of autophagic bodies
MADCEGCQTLMHTALQALLAIASSSDALKLATRHLLQHHADYFVCGSARVPFPLRLTMCNCGSITMVTWGGATAGFMQQFAAVCHPDRSETNMAAVLKELSGGQTPNRVICTGHSLGGALATLG